MKIGDKVTLYMGGGVPGFGGLNTFFLREEGYSGQELTIKSESGYSTVNGHCWIVELPSGYNLDIHKGDIQSHRSIS